MATETWTSRARQLFSCDLELSGECVTRILAVFGTAALALVCYRKLWRETKKFPPGLPALPIVGSIPFLKFADKDTHLYTMELFEKHGNIFSMWLGNMLVVNLGGYDVIREALVDQSVAFAGRPSELIEVWYLINPKLTGILDQSYSPAWKRDRHVSLSILRDFGFGRNLMESRIQQEVQGLVDYIRSLKGQPYDPRPTLTTSVGNVICSIILGKSYPLDDCAELQSVIEDIDLLFQASPKMTPLLFLPSLKHLPYFKRVVQSAVKPHDRVQKFLREIIKQHEKSYQDGNENDFIDCYIGQVGRDSDYTDDLAFLLRDLLMGGTETTATTLQWAMLYMANYPHIQVKVQDEITNELGQGQTVTLEHKKRLPYTEAVLLELQRVTVLAPNALPHMTLSDVKLRGYDIPKNTMVMVSLWSVLRDPDLWSEPERFIPERFLDDEGKVVHRPELINFSLGRRSCLGEVMARQEMFLFFCELMRNFTVRAPEGAGKLDEKGKTFVTRAPLSFEVIAEPRM